MIRKARRRMNPLDYYSVCSAPTQRPRRNGACSIGSTSNFPRRLRMKILTLLCSLCLFAFAAAAGAADKSSENAAKLDRADSSAMKKLAGANMAEIETGKLAASKSQNADVKKFGQQMVDDHTKMLDDL